MLLVILGAGASYDSLPSRRPSPRDARRSQAPKWKKAEHDYWRPPLADDLFSSHELFEEVRRDYPILNGIVPQLQSRREGVSVEDRLEQLQAEAATNPKRLPQLVAVRFYLRELLMKCQNGWNRSLPVESNYDALLDQLGQAGFGADRTIFVSFNYDLLLEDALAHERRMFRTMDDYIRDDGFRLFKLHGSLDWVRRAGKREIGDFTLSGPSSHNSVIERAPSLDFNGEILRDANLEPGNDLFVPALAVPLKTKSQFECPPEHLARLGELLPQVRGILTIGWRAGEAHFLSVLKKHIRPLEVLHCVSGTESASLETADALRDTVVARNDIHEAGGFSDFITAGSSERLFRLLNLK